MSSRFARPITFALAILSVATTAGAQTDGGGIALDRYLEALEKKRLIARETGSAERLREQVRRAEEAYFEERYDAAARLLYDAVESPRFADFAGLEEFHSAELMLASALAEMGALRTSARYLLRVLKRGPQGNNYFGPAFRKYVDVALEGGRLEDAIERIEALELGALPEDARNELRYLRGRLAYDASNFDAAERHFAAITRRSRFYANAQYLRGVIDTAAGELQRAEDHFCSIATTDKQDQYTFYVDERYFEVKDLAWLALGRVAHEGGRSEDAFYYYFQVPQDSDRVAQALFEAAFAMYEGEDHATAEDLLDQLEAHFPRSPFVDEAALLRGYVHLARCEFERADRLFRRFQAEFRPLVAEIDRIVANPARQAGLYEALLAEERSARQAGDGSAPGVAGRTRRLLLALLRVDPTFYELHSRIRTLDAEAARAGRLPTEVRAIARRLEGEDRPRAAVRQEPLEGEVDRLRRDIEAARAVLARMTEQIDVMRRAGATSEQLAPLERRLREVSTRLVRLERRLRKAAAGATTGAPPAAPDRGADLPALLRRDLAYVQRLPLRVAAVRAKLVRAANAAAMRALRELRERLSSELRRARIGRIDAVMGSKRRIEIQIESLAAGRFPPELQDPLRVQGLLRDDEEYWPFEGEYWADELEQGAPPPQEGR